MTPASGPVTTEQRLAVRVDWSRAPSGTRTVPITITGPGTSRVVVQAVVHNPARPHRDSVVGFVQGGAGYVSMEAEHFTRAVTSAAVQWQRIPDLGRTRSGMIATPVTVASQTPGGTAPRLEYQVHTTDSGSVRVRVYLSPTLNFTGAATGLRYAMSIDDEAPQVVNMIPDTTNAVWEKSVGDNIVTMVTRHELRGPGTHTVKFWVVDPGVVLQKLVLETRDLPNSYLGPPESYYRPSVQR